MPIVPIFNIEYYLFIEDRPIANTNAEDTLRQIPSVFQGIQEINVAIDSIRNMGFECLISRNDLYVADRHSFISIYFLELSDTALVMYKTCGGEINDPKNKDVKRFSIFNPYVIFLPPTIIEPKPDKFWHRIVKKVRRKYLTNS
jgi:hypothetical protein